MGRKKVEVVEEVVVEEVKAPRKKKIVTLDAEFNRLDLEALRQKVNELVDAHNA